MSPSQPADPVERALGAILDAPPVRDRELLGVWLFGSRARAEERPDSDVDLALLTRPELGLERALLSDLAARASGLEVDVIDLASAPAALAWEVLTTGRLIVERDELAVSDFLRRARFAAEDAAQRDRMILLAQVGRVGGRTR